MWDFEDYKGAFERLDGGHANGKVVTKVTELICQERMSRFTYVNVDLG